MSAESLSPNQVENLLKAMESAHGGENACAGDRAAEQQSAVGKSLSETSGREPPATPAAAETGSVPAPAGSHGSEPTVPAGDRGSSPSVTPYDFRSPDRVGKEQLQTLWSLHETVAESFALSASELLRVSLDVKVLSVQPADYATFVASREKPTCLSVIAPTPLDGKWLLDMPSSLAFAIIDRMLGGDPIPGEVPPRPLTEIENRLISRLVALFIEPLAPAWNAILTLNPTLESIESRPHQAQVARPDETIIQTDFEIQWGTHRETITLCIPYRTIETYRDRLAHAGMQEPTDRAGADFTRGQIAERMDAANVSVVVSLAHSRIKTSDLLGLTVGDIITTEQATDAPLELAIQDVPKFHASAGAYQGQKAAQVQSMIDPKRRRRPSGEAAETECK
ncbi:flagellar motor switch protein FliM [Allorhodopirellula solitaria]|uniref:Flagellar motor switch protein FliM n=1 Tax=Allorhodopirellula solitaria TaxID=2527987 RepID=A0A5C5X1Z6_9BACT|nr:FliM/FliN family flagellar motor switch protein [Allorhodopirellula solitaria]TWT56183.1 Flagellar motor switch protein FliM [Allorhodopirellula solitaria]